MLSTSVIKNTSEASHYYSSRDNYYTKEEGISQSEWYGKGAVRLDLLGEVDANQFTALLAGKLPNGEQLGKNINGYIKHRAGWDLTFSAPKSVSIMALIGGDKRLIDAHRNAVKTALAQIERSASEARIKVNSDISFVNTKNMIAALYHHDLSREQDPQLHTHSVVMNMTERADGKWRSQASKIGRYDKKANTDVHGFIERVRNNKRYFGKLYEAELCYQVNQLGYKTEVNTKTGVFEILDVPKTVNEHFSKRRSIIEKSLTENGFESAKAADVANIKTRKIKRNVDRLELKEQWKREAKKLGLNCQEIIDQSSQVRSKKLNDLLAHEIKVSDTLLKSIKTASNELSQFKTTFLLEEVVTHAAEQAIREKISVDSLLGAVNELIKNGELISISSKSGKTVLMDKSILTDEENIKSHLATNHLKNQLIASTAIEQFIEQHSEIKQDVKNALNNIFSDSAFVLIDGDRSCESLLKPIIQIMKANHKQVTIISPNQLSSQRTSDFIAQESKTLWEHVKSLFIDTSIPHFSTRQFLLDGDVKNTDFLIIEQSHLLSTNELSHLMSLSKDKQKKIIFLGNSSVILSRKQGKGLPLLIENGVNRVSLAESQDSIKSFVSQDDLKVVSQKIVNFLHEIQSSDERLSKMAMEYIHESDKKNIFLVANNKKAVSELNQLTHNELKKSNQLGKGQTVRVLLPQFINETQAKLSKTYHKGAVVRFNETMSSHGIRYGDYCEILSQNKEKNAVHIKNSRGKTVIWHPDKMDVKIELFNPVYREICAGERIQVQRGIKGKSTLKGEYLTVHSISNDKIIVINNKNKKILLNSRDAKCTHFDYGYAANPHQIVHEKPSKIIAELPHRSFHTDKRQFYQVVSQPNEISIYTDNKDALIGTLERKSGNKMSAHETVNQSNELKKSLHTLHDILNKALSKEGSTDRSIFSQKSADALDYAVNHLAEKEAAFEHKELMMIAMQHALGAVSSKEFEQTITAMEKQNIIIRKNTNSGTLWTTLEAVNTERKIVAFCNQGKGRFQKLVPIDIVDQKLKSSILNSEQTSAIREITQSKDRIISIQGRAGTGKTTLMTTLKGIVTSNELCLLDGYHMPGLAPTHSAIKELNDRGIHSQTLDSFLLDMQKKSVSGIKQDFSRTIFILDEASMVSNDKMLAILKMAHDLNFRQLILVGDDRQLSSSGAGKPNTLVKRSIDPIMLENIQRQKNPVLQQAVKETYAFNFTEAFKTLKDSIIEIGNPNQYRVDNYKHDWEEISKSGRIERIKALVSDYTSYPPESRQDVLLITPGHEDRNLTNVLIRDQLKQEGTLAGKEHILSILSAKNLTYAERSNIRVYKKNDVIRFSKTEGMVKAGEYWTVQESKISHNGLILKNTEGSEVFWQLPKTRQKDSQTFEVFKREDRAIQVGDIIRWSRTDKANHLYSSEPVKVISLNNKNVTLESMHKKNTMTVDLKKAAFQHWDYNYALTVYSAQGATKKTVLALLESYRENLIHQPAFLVALTRAVNTFRVYTDDKVALLDRIIQNDGVKLSALETIDEIAKITNQRNLNTLKMEKKTISHRSFDRQTVERIIAALNQDAEKIATDFLGKPASRTPSFLQFGRNKGSLRVTIHGSKSGLWNDFSGEVGSHGKTGGNMFQFLQVFGGMTKKEALTYGAHRLGLLKDDEMSSKKDKEIQRQKDNKKQLKQQKESEKKQQESRIKFAKKLAEESKSIQGTLAEKYLKNERGISVSSYPADIRFHEGIYSKLNGETYPAMLVIARDKQGEIKAVQAIYLDSNGKKINRDTHAIQKQTFGILSGSAVTVKGEKPGVTFIAEGVETGLSIAQASPKNEVKILLGKSNLLHIDLKDTKKNITLCLDNDGKNITEDKVIFEAARRLNEAGKSVNLIVPMTLGNVKQDYNDVLKKVGVVPIQHDIQKAVSFHDLYQTKPQNHSSTHSISQTKINQFARDIANQSLKDEQKLLSMNRKINSSEINKTPVQQPQREREI